MFCQALDRTCLGQPRESLDQEVAVREQSDQNTLDNMLLTDDVL